MQETKIPKLNFLPPQLLGDDVRVDVVDTAPEGVALAPFKASKIIVYPGHWSPLDNHEVKECWMISSGQGELVYNDDVKEPIKAGDVLFYDSFNSHKVFNNGSEDLIIFSLWWDK